jgi:hypothetical protein
MFSTYAALLTACVTQAAGGGGVTRYVASLGAESQYFAVSNGAAGSPLEVVINPRIGLEYEERGLLFGMAYFPQIVIGSTAALQYLHQAQFLTRVEMSPTLKVTFNAAGSYGTRNYTLQTPATPGPIQTLPSDLTPLYTYGLGSVELDYRGSELFRAAFTLSYIAQGGADADSRASLPLAYGPNFVGLLEWRVSKDDTLGIVPTVYYYNFLPGEPAWVAQLVGTWKRSLSPDASIRLGAGVGVAGQVLGFPALVLRSTSPIGDVVYAQTLRGPDIRIGLSAHAGPFIDLTTGNAYQRADLAASVSIGVHRDWRLEGAFSGGLAMNGPQRGQLTSSSQAAAAWTPATWARLSFGVRGLTQTESPNIPGSAFQQVGTFFSVLLQNVGPL